MERRVLACRKTDMSVIRRFCSVAEAALAYGINEASMRDKCYRRGLEKSDLAFRYEDDFDPDESFEGKRNRPVEAVSGEFGYTKVYASAEEAAESEGVDVQRVRDACCKMPKRPSEGVGFRYHR